MMNKEKQKKILNFIKSSTFCNGFLILCSLIGAGISLTEFNATFGLDVINILGFPIAFTIGVNGLIFIPMICERKLAELEETKTEKIDNPETSKSNDIQLEIVKKTNSSEQLINTIDNILLANPSIGVKIDLLPEWQEYLENTFIDASGIKLVQELIYYLMLLNTLPLEKVVPLLKEREDILDLLIHFSNNGEYLAKELNREIKDIKRERTI